MGGNVTHLLFHLFAEVQVVILQLGATASLDFFKEFRGDVLTCNFDFVDSVGKSEALENWDCVG